jgi:putative heme-binding domain-containing protein
LTGVISEETPSSITLLQAGGTRQVLARRQILTLKSSKLSLMPDGFEKALTQQSMADLIRFLKSK